MVRVIGFDTETYKDGDIHKLISIQVYSPELGLNHFLTDWKDLANLFTYKTRGAYFFANNCEFDILAIKDLLIDRGFKIRLFYSSSKFIKAIIRDKNKHYWQVRDLSNLYHNFSLAKIGKIIGIPKLEKPPYLGKRKPLGHELEYFRKYAMRDAEISYWAGRKWLDEFQTKSATIGGTSIKIFMSMADNINWDKIIGRKINKKAQLCYRGGRCESFVRGYVDKKVYAYDVVSMYPSVMKENPFPLTWKGYKKKWSIDLDKEGFAKVKVIQEGHITPLMVKRDVKYYNAYGRERIMPKLISFEGKIIDYFTYPELRYLENSGFGKILDVYEAYEFSDSDYFFRDFVNQMFKIRKELKEQGNEFQKIYKLILNSLYGKFGQHKGGKIYDIEKDYMDVINSNGDSYARYTNFVWASYITAYARLKLFDYFLKVSKDKEMNEILYCDTDSVFSTRYKPLLSNKLGHLEYKGMSDHAIFIRAKGYTFDNHVVYKGVFIPLKEINLMDMIAKGKLTISKKKILKLREAYRRKFNEIAEIEKTYRINIYEDGKRKYEKDINGKDLLFNMTYSHSHKFNEG